MMVTPLALRPAQALEQRLDARRREHGGRLVEDQHLRLGHQRPGNLDALLQLDRQVADAVARAAP